MTFFCIHVRKEKFDISIFKMISQIQYDKKKSNVYNAYVQLLKYKFRDLKKKQVVQVAHSMFNQVKNKDRYDSTSNCSIKITNSTSSEEKFFQMLRAIDTYLSGHTARKHMKVYLSTLTDDLSNGEQSPTEGVSANKFDVSFSKPSPNLFNNLHLMPAETSSNKKATRTINKSSITSTSLDIQDNSQTLIPSSKVLAQDNELRAWSSKRKGIYDDILTNAANRKVKKIRTIAPRDEDIEYDLLNSNPLQDFNSGDDVGFAIPSNETQLNDDFSQTIQEIDKNLEQNDNDNDSATLSPRNNPTISQGTRTSPSKIQEQTQREKEKFYRKKKVSINSSKQKIDKNTNLFESIKDLNKMDSYIDVMKLNIQRIVTHCKTSNTVITLYKFKQNVELEMNIQRETMQKIKSLVEVYEQMNLHLDKKITSIQTSHKKYVFDLISDEENDVTNTNEQ